MEAKFACARHLWGKVSRVAHFLVLLELISKKYGAIQPGEACGP